MVEDHLADGVDTAQERPEVAIRGVGCRSEVADGHGAEVTVELEVALGRPPQQSVGSAVGLVDVVVRRLAALDRPVPVESESTRPPLATAIDLSGAAHPRTVEDLCGDPVEVGGVDLANRAGLCAHEGTSPRVVPVRGVSGRRCVAEASVDGPLGGDQDAERSVALAGNLEGVGQHPSQQPTPPVRGVDGDGGERVDRDIPGGAARPRDGDRPVLGGQAGHPPSVRPRSPDALGGPVAAPGLDQPLEGLALGVVEKGRRHAGEPRSHVV